MTTKQLVLSTVLALGCQTMAFAATNASAPQAGKNSALEAAIAACSSSVAKDSRSGPDMSAMDACMQAKGFTRPAGPPPSDSKPGAR